jgi:hypothetical protein
MSQGEASGTQGSGREGWLPVALFEEKSLQPSLRVSKLSRWSRSRAPEAAHLGKIGEKARVLFHDTRTIEDVVRPPEALLDRIRHLFGL